MTYRVLVVDDYELWRRHIGSALHKQPHWRIVGEAADGLEAVSKARVLEPDLILLDVSLPTLDGIEAARRILAFAPGSKVLFLSEHRSRDIVDAALAARASGYILKSDAGRDLLAAMQAIVEGKQFISASLAAQSSERATADTRAPKACRHEAGFHTDETSLVEDYARFAGAALEAGKALILVVSGLRRDRIHQRLRAHGLDLDRAVEEGRYFPIDEEDLLSTFMIDGRLDEARFLAEATALVSRAADAVGGHCQVAACGDGAATLWKAGSVDAAVRIEQLWSVLARTHDVDVFCGYLVTAGDEDEDAGALQRIRAEHSDGYSR